MYAFITGASSGIGLEIAKILVKQYDLILVARDEKKLESTRRILQEMNQKHNIICYSCDVSNREQCRRCFETFQETDIEIVINGAGFGVYGDFLDTSCQAELDMIDTNVCGAQLIMKYFLKKLVQQGHGYFLNIASSAGYMPGGPKMAGYYASKAYLLSLTRSVAQELKDRGSHVYLGALCPGPVKTAFNLRAGVANDIQGISPQRCGAYAIKQMFRRKQLIIPGFTIWWTYLGSKLVSDSILLKIAGRIQAKKGNIIK